MDADQRQRRFVFLEWFKLVGYDLCVTITQREMEEEMRQSFASGIGVFLIATAIPAPSIAGTMKGWVEDAYKQIDSPLIETLQIYRSNGFVLIDVASNYAAYSFRAQRLTQAQREKIGAVEGSATLVLSYRSCAPQTGWMNGNISQITIKNTVEEAADLAEELRELVEFSEEMKFKAWGFGASKARKDQVFMGWNDANENSVEIQINKQTHQLVWQINKACPKN